MVGRLNCFLSLEDSNTSNLLFKTPLRIGLGGAILPKSVHKFFKKCSSRFLFFGEVNSNKKLHMIAWNKVCLPFSRGGLGIYSIPAMQFSFNCSVILRMYNSASPLSMWLLDRYISPWNPSRCAASNFWKSIRHTASIAKHCFKFKFNNFANISLKWDHWWDNGSISDRMGNAFMHLIPDIPLKRLISDASWAVPDFFPAVLREAISSLCISDGAHCLFWYDKEFGKFKSFMEEFHFDIPKVNWYKMIWHKRNSLKYSVYSWLAIMGGLKTAEALRLRNITVNRTCCLCYANDESVSHLYFECPYSFYILTNIISGMKYFLLRPNIQQVFDWIRGNYYDNLEKSNFYKLVVSSVIYYVWRERNNRIFGNNFQYKSTLLLCIKRALAEKVLRWKNALVFLEQL